MKKSLLLLTFACFLFAGTQISFSQTKAKTQNSTISNTDDSGKKHALKIINLLEREAKLEASQKEKLYDVFAALNKKMKNIEEIKDAEERQIKKTKMQTYVNQKLQQILTEEQYALYLKKTTPH